MVHLELLLASLPLLPPGAPASDRDTDRDGLTDFHEVHKYGTDPEASDSDGDGVPDGDWLERREFAYTVRSVVHVMRPVTLEYLNDDYQDVRLLDEAPDYVELEVVHYPFNTVADGIEGGTMSRRESRELARWLQPGPTSDWTPELRKELVRALAKDGIDVRKLNDKELVERVSAWLLEHARSEDGFSTFVTSFDSKGKPFLGEELRDSVLDGRAEDAPTLEEQWAREISARGMFENGARGSCTSSAIYLSGCLRALGIPTRTVLCIPLIDASDERERELASRLRHPLVRKAVTSFAEGAEGSWASHTFNEVWVGGRWRRLNYDRLGQNILDEHYLGLMTHVGTFFDWADARMPETVGRRQELGLRSDVFGGPNPYSTISIREIYGPHADIRAPEKGERRLVVSSLLWTDDDTLPRDIRESNAERGRFGLIAIVPAAGSGEDVASFVAEADGRVFLDAENHPRLGIGFDRGCYWRKNGTLYIYLPFGGADKRDLVEGVSYKVRARNDAPGFVWEMPGTIVR